MALKNIYKIEMEEYNHDYIYYACNSNVSMGCISFKKDFDTQKIRLVYWNDILDENSSMFVLKMMEEGIITNMEQVFLDDKGKLKSILVNIPKKF